MELLYSIFHAYIRKLYWDPDPFEYKNKKVLFSKDTYIREIRRIRISSNILA